MVKWGEPHQKILLRGKKMSQEKTHILLIDTPPNFSNKINSEIFEIDQINLFTSGDNKQTKPYHEYDYIVFSPKKISTGAFISLNRSESTGHYRVPQTMKAIENGTLLIIFIQQVNWENDNRKEKKRIESSIYRYFCKELVIQPLKVPHNESSYEGDNHTLREIFDKINKIGHKPIYTTLSVSDSFGYWIVFPLASNKVGEMHSIILRRGKGAIVFLPEYKNNVSVTNMILDVSNTIKNLPLNIQDDILNEKIKGACPVHS